MNTKSEYTKKKEYFEFVKGMIVLCVILAHFPVPEIPEFLHRICFSFHMPLIFLIVGYGFQNKEFSTLLSEKAKQFLIPYLFCLIGLIGASAFGNIFSMADVSLEQNILNWIWAGIYGSGNAYSEPFWIESIGIIWIFPALFWSMLVFHWCVKRKNPFIWIILFITVGLYTKKYFWLPFSVQAAFLCVAYIYIGYIEKRKAILKRIFRTPYWVAAMFLLWASYLAIGGGKLYLVAGSFELGFLCDFFFSIIASACVLYLCWQISGLKWRIKNVIPFWGRNFLKVLCVHVIELSIFPWWHVRLFFENIGINRYTLTAILYGIKLLLITVAVVLINKTEEKWRLRKEKKIDEMISAEKLSFTHGGLLPFAHEEYVLVGIIWFALIIADLPLPESVRQISCSYFVPFVFVAAGYILGKKIVQRKYWELGKALLGGYAACRIGYLAVQLWQSVLYSSGSDSGVILRDWFTVSIWGLSNSSKILASVGNVGALWILPCLLCCGILTAVLLRSNSMVFQIAAAVIAGMVGIYLGQKGLFLPFSLDVALAGMPLFLAGHLGYQNKDQLRKPMLQGGIVFFSVCWLVLARWKGIDLAARMYPLGILSVICAASVGLLSLILIDDCSLPDTVQFGLEWAGKHGIMLLGIHCAVQRLAPWNSAAAAASVGGQLLIEAAIIIPTGILLILIARWIHNLENKRDWANDLYLVVLTLYFVRAFFDTTMFRFPWPVSFYPVIRVLMLVVAWKKIMQMQEWKQLVACCAAALIFCFSFMMTGYEFLFDLGVLIIGAVGVPYKKILQSYMICGLIIMYVAFIASLTGCIDELVYRDGEAYKHSFGICYPTDFAAHLVYLVLAFWVTFRKIPVILSAFIMVGLTVFLVAFCKTQCSEIVLLLALVCVLYVWISDYLMNRSKHFKRIFLYADWVCCSISVFCAALIIALSFKFDWEIPKMVTLNEILSDRLQLAQKAFLQYGISWFGTPFEMIGNGGAVVSRVKYNFVDSSFCLILVRYGILSLITVLAIFSFTAVKALKSGNRRIVFALALIAIHSMIEHHLLELAYNPFLLLSFCSMKKTQDERSIAKREKIPQNRIVQVVIYSLLVLLLLYIAPIILDYGRTMVTLLQLYKEKKQLYFIFVLLILSASVAMIMIVGFNSFKVHKRCGINRKRVSLLFGSCLTVIVFFGLGESVIWKNRGMYESTLESGKNLLSMLIQQLNGEDYKIFVADIPSVYQREIDGISNRILPAEALANNDNVILVANKNEEINLLIQAGYEFGEISDTEGIYTNCENAIKIIEDSGIPMYACYSVEKTVDLADLAWKNGLEMNEKGDLIVDGESKSLIYGPYDVIYRGTLEVTYQIKLLRSSIEEGEIAYARLSSDYGENIVKRKSITREDFDEEGNATIVIKQYINDSEGIEYLLFANGDSRIAVQNISYKKVEQ